MADLTAKSSLKLLALRAVKLDDDGSYLDGATSTIVHVAPILLKHSGDVPDRERFEQVNGEGNKCAQYVGPPREVESVALSTELCVLDAPVIEALAGGSVFTDGSDIVGWQATTEATVNVNGVALEVWSMAWNGRQRATKDGNPATWRTGFTKTTWQVGEITYENGFAKIPLTGVGEVNDQFLSGPADDWPQDLVAPWGYFLDGPPPEGITGYGAFPLAS